MNFAEVFVENSSNTQAFVRMSGQPSFQKRTVDFVDYVDSIHCENMVCMFLYRLQTPDVADLIQARRIRCLPSKCAATYPPELSHEFYSFTQEVAEMRRMLSCSQISPDHGEKKTKNRKRNRDDNPDSTEPQMEQEPSYFYAYYVKSEGLLGIGVTANLPGQRSDVENTYGGRNCEWLIDFRHDYAPKILSELRNTLTGLARKTPRRYGLNTYRLTNTEAERLAAFLQLVAVSGGLTVRETLARLRDLGRVILEVGGG